MNKILFGLFLVLFMSNVASVLAQPQTDPAGDFLDRRGQPTGGEPYLDVIESDVELTGGNYVCTIKLAGTVPSQTSGDIFVEWDLMVDADESSTTGAWGGGEPNITVRQLMVNGIGVDLMVRLAMNSITRWAEVYLVSDQSWSNIASYTVSANEVTLTIAQSWASQHLRRTAYFDYTVLVRKYSGGGAANALPTLDKLQAFDKAPGVGYYAWRAGAVSVVPEFPATQAVAAIVFSLVALTLNLRKTRKSVRNHNI